MRMGATIFHDAPKAREVLVKVVTNGVYHSDYSVIHGVLPLPLPVPPWHAMMSACRKREQAYTFSRLPSSCTNRL
jgi:hypothetical protein